ALVNGVGATATGIVALVVVYTKFAEGAWLVTVAIPVLVVGMLGVRRHYRRLARRMRAGAAAVVAAAPAHNTTLLVVEHIDEAAERAMRVARAISSDGVRAVHVPARGTDPGIRSRVLVSGVDAASMRAVNYARTLGVDEVRAVHFAFSPEDAGQFEDEWRQHGPRIPLEIDDAPYRDVGVPLLQYLRDLTAEEGTEV